MILVYFSYENPIEFQRGDEVKVTCGFKTKDRQTTTFKGDGTADEMCFGFFTFYPAENIPVPYCTAWKSLDRNRAYYGQVNGCNVFGFVNASHPDTMRLHQKVLSHCSHLGLCLKECKDVIKEVKRTEPCIQGDLNDFFRDIARTDAKYIQMGLFFSAMDSCNKEMALESCPTPPGPTGMAVMAAPSYLLLTLMLAFFGLKH